MMMNSTRRPLANGISSRKKPFVVVTSTLMMMMFLCIATTMTTTKVSAFAVTPSSSTPTTMRARATTTFATTNEWGIPHPDDLPALSESIVDVLPNGGRITLLGSGPGDPELLTLKAARLLQDPNALVVADRLVSQEILELIRGDLRTARKLPGCAELAQDEIYAWCHAGLADGKHVIRLKIGDPFVFGRGGEEVLQFRRYGVQAQVVPGVSSAFSAPLLGNIPVTHRGVANQVVMTTGYGREGTCPDLIQYHPEQTLVFLMAVGRLGQLCERLVADAKYPADTPVAIVERAGCPNQRTVVGDMTSIAALAKQYNVKPPSTIVVGNVVKVLLDADAVTGETVTGLIQNATAVTL